jgi:uncharacterized protein
MGADIFSYEMFKQGLKEGKLLGLKCADCGELIFPAQAVCPACSGSSLDVNSFSPKGEIRTFTVVHVGPAGFKAPYVVAMVELEEGPWAMGNVIGVDAPNVDIGLIGKGVSIGPLEVPGDPAEGSAGGLALAFELVE